MQGDVPIWKPQFCKVYLYKIWYNFLQIAHFEIHIVEKTSCTKWVHHVLASGCCGKTPGKSEPCAFKAENLRETSFSL